MGTRIQKNIYKKHNLLVKYSVKLLVIAKRRVLSAQVKCRKAEIYSGVLYIKHNKLRLG